MAKNSLHGLLGGYTHAVLVDVDKIKANSSAGDTAVTIGVIGLPADSIVKDVTLHGFEGFTGGNSTLTATVGDGTDPDGFIVSVSLFEATATKYCDGAYFSTGGNDNTVNGKYYTNADQVDITITADSDLHALTAGKVLVLCNICDPAAYA